METLEQDLASEVVCPEVAHARFLLSVYLTENLHNLDSHLPEMIRLARLPKSAKPWLEKSLRIGNYCQVTYSPPTNL